MAILEDGDSTGVVPQRNDLVDRGGSPGLYGLGGMDAGPAYHRSSCAGAAERRVMVQELPSYSTPRVQNRPWKKE